MAGGMGGEPLSTGDQLALVEKSVLLGSGKSISKSSPRNSIRQLASWGTAVFGLCNPHACVEKCHKLVQNFGIGCRLGPIKACMCFAWYTQRHVRRSLRVACLGQRSFM